MGKTAWCSGIRVSIPNGHPKPFSPEQEAVLEPYNKVSIPNGHPKPFSRAVMSLSAFMKEVFQSPTGIPSHLAPSGNGLYYTQNVFVSIPNGHPKPFSLRP